MKDNEVLVAVIGVAAGAYILEHFSKSNNAYSYQATTTDEFYCEVCKKSHNGYVCSGCLDINQGGGSTDVYPVASQPSISYPNDIDRYRQKEQEAQRREEEKTKRLEEQLRAAQHPQHPTTSQHPSTSPHTTPTTTHSPAPVHTTTPTSHPSKQLLGYGEGPMDIGTTDLYGFYDLDSGFGGSGGGMGGGVGGDYGGPGGEVQYAYAGRRMRDDLDIMET